MRKIYSFYVAICFLLITLSSHAAFNGDYVFSLESVTQTQLDNNISTPQTGMMVYNTSDNNVYYYNGTDWIAYSSKGRPFIDNNSKQIVPPSITYSFTINGKDFAPDTTVSIVNPPFTGTVNSVTVLSPRKLEVNVTTPAIEDIHDIVLSNNGILNTQWAGNGVDMFEVQTSTWLDLRLGGDAFTDGNAGGNDIRYRSGMSMTRDADGMYFTGNNPWNSWVKFESLGWNRGANLTLQWIFTQPDNFMVIGIGSTATDENSGVQYAQAEVGAYFASSTNLSGLRGNTGTVGTFASQNQNASLNSCISHVFKVKFENDGTVGSQVTLYCLPSAGVGSWSNEATIMKTFAIAGTLNPNEVNIMPFIIPRDGGGQRFIAVKVE